MKKEKENEILVKESFELKMTRKRDRDKRK